MKQLLSNIVKQERLKEVQSRTLKEIADVVMRTAGPYGTNAILLHDSKDGNSALNEYSKDGHKVLKNIRFYDPLEYGIQTELVEFTQHIVNTVGDGTTSAIKLASLIFDQLLEFQKSHKFISPIALIRSFQEIVEKAKDEILKTKKDITTDDIYKICMISTNGDEVISKNIQEIYENLGMGVFINVCISNTTQSFTKAYDGLTLQRGYNSAAFINTSNGICRLKNPKIYCFEDPIDNEEMMAFFSKITLNNFMDPKDSFIPTFIIAPSISRDASMMLEEIENTLYRLPETARAPFLIITGINQEFDSYRDIARLCGCPMIKKYINPDVQDKDIAEGKAPNMETIVDWCGSAELVECDNLKTKFINPAKMHDGVDEDGNLAYSSVYLSMLNFFEGELQHAIDNSEDITIIGNLRRRLNCLKANMVDYYIGGVSVTDRDSVRDLVEDAVLNCRSAAVNGVGHGANFEGLRSLYNILNTKDIDWKYAVSKELVSFIENAYVELTKQLYMTAGLDEETATDYIVKSIKLGTPYNLKTGEFDGDVLASINTDIVILDTISKIITIMFTANQALLVSPLNNKYLEKE